MTKGLLSPYAKRAEKLDDIEKLSTNTSQMAAKLAQLKDKVVAL